MAACACYDLPDRIITYGRIRGVAVGGRVRRFTLSPMRYVDERTIVKLEGRNLVMGVRCESRRMPTPYRGHHRVCPCYVPERIGKKSEWRQRRRAESLESELLRLSNKGRKTRSRIRPVLPRTVARQIAKTPWISSPLTRAWYEPTTAKPIKRRDRRRPSRPRGARV